MKDYTVTAALKYLEANHGITLGSAGLRMHLPGGKKTYRPHLYGEYHESSGMWFFTRAQLDRFAREYNALKSSGDQFVGKVGRKRTK